MLERPFLGSLRTLGCALVFLGALSVGARGTWGATNLTNVLPAAAGDTTLSADLDTPNAYGTNVELVFAKGSHVVVAAGGASAKVTGALTAKLPYYNDKGVQATLTVATATANVSSNGAFNLTVTNGTPGGALAGGPISLAGFDISTNAIDLKITRAAGGNGDLTVGLKNASVGTILPHLLLKNDDFLELATDVVTIKGDGKPSFTSKKPAAPQTLQLLQPLDFSLTITGVDVAVVAAKITKFNLTHFDVGLPPELRDDKGKAITIPGQTDADLSTKGVVIQVSKLPPIAWNSFTLHISKALLDLSTGPSDLAHGAEKGTNNATLPDSWEGVYVTQATLDLPHTFDSGGKTTSIGVAGFYLDGQGINGQITAASMNQAGIHLLDFPVSFQSGYIQFERSRVTAGHIVAAMSVTGADKPIGLSISFTTAGLVTVDIDPNQDIGLGAFGMKLQLTSGTFKRTPEGVGEMLLSGSFTFPAISELGGLVLQFKDLGIDTKGNLYAKDNAVTLTHPAELELGGVIGVHIEKLEIASDHIKLTGGVRVSDDLPMNGDVNFTGLTISKGPKLDLGGISIDFKAMDMATVHADLEHKDKNNVSYFQGNARLTLDFAGPSDTMGGDASMLVGDRCWFVVAHADLSATPIALGPSGLAIVGFNGGVGHNVGFDPKFLADPHGKSATADVMIPDPKLNNLVFLAGADVAVAGGKQLLWANTTLTVADPPLVISMDGTVYYLDASNPPSGDRSGYADITWNGADSSFRAGLGVDFFYPSRSANIFEVHGSAELLLAPNKQHLFIGWPITGDGAHPIEVKVVGISSSSLKGGIGLEMNPDQFAQAGFMLSEDLLGILKGEIDGNVGITSNAGDAEIHAHVHASGEADLVIISAYVDASLDAWMSERELDVAGELSGSVSTFFGSIGASVDLPRTKILPF